MTGPALAILMCIAEVIGMLNFSTFQALIPTFRQEWGLTNTEAGWISGIYFAGYTVTVPVLVSMTDRVDPRRVTLISLVVGAMASVGYAVLADGFWTAMIFRCLQGVGLAGTYMPGLKALSDQTEGSSHQSRYVAFYTASFGIGAGLSYPLAGEVTALFGWQWAFAINALGSAAALVLIWFGLRPATPPATETDLHLLDFRPVLRNRRAMAFILGYAGHNWELFAFRSWVVAFLVFAAGDAGDGWSGLNATGIAAIATLLGVPASIFGNELAVRFGRRRVILVTTALSVVVGCVLGFSSGLSYTLAAGLCFVCGWLLTGDSAALTAGTVRAAEAGQRGATLAVHASLGFLGGVFGPLLVGVALDIAGAATWSGWGFAFVVGALGSVFAFIAVHRGGRTA